MDVLEFSVDTDAEGAEAVAAVFSAYAYGGPVIEEHVSPEAGEPFDPARPFTVRAFLLMDETAEANRAALEEAVWHLSQLRAISEPRVRVLKDEDWANAWKKDYAVQHPGARVVIQPSWLEYTPRPGEVVIVLDPGMAFGSGLHATTRLCIRALEAWLWPGMRVLDVGTGSGILAIAAAKLGAGGVDAVDIDPVATLTAQENVDRNGVADVVHVPAGTLAEADAAGALAAGYDLIVANILAETIAALTPALIPYLAPEGRLIVSGILAEKADMVRLAWAAAGVAVLEETREEDWVALAGEREALPSSPTPSPEWRRGKRQDQTT